MTRPSRTGVPGYLLRVAGPERTPALNHHLACLLALVAGVLNSVGFVAVAFYTSHMTGVTALIADQIVLGGWYIVAIGVLSILSFVVGAMICAIIFNWGRRRGLRSRYANVLLLEGLLMLVFGLLAEELTHEDRELLFVPVLCFTMGLQNAVITKISGARIRTTHVTGMVTDIGIELGKLVYRNHRPDTDPVRGNRSQIRLHGTLVSLFLIGGIIGAAGYLVIGFAVLVPGALLLLLASYQPLLADLGARAEGHL
ncbi:YoaK family protein [Janibacter alittae]|uniref:YoaK family protein n=1 Tax=Janibacter alittae TaxID=3115209 RepID=A0ABZ2MG34_9MICO